MVEDGRPDALRDAIRRLHPRTGHAHVVGITGSPGVGKSTLTNAIAAEVRARGRTVAVVAVDPSSPFTGGALLGDRVRMQAHHADDGVFIRSMAARGHLGGISLATPQAVLVLDAAGFDVVVIETVGVGQGEVEVAATADTTIVTVAPNMGDSIQAAKAGILEVADVFVINKADHGGAGRTESELRGMLELGHELRGASTEDVWEPPIVRSVASRPEGVDAAVDAIEAHARWAAASGAFERRRRERALHTVREIALEQVRRQFKGVGDDGEGLLDTLAARVAQRDLDPYAAADELVASLD